MNPARQNLLADLPSLSAGEDFAVLLRLRNLVIERIVSSGRSEPVLYNQDQDEWVLLIEGRAVLELAGERIDMEPGDHVFIPAHTPHRVLATIPEPRCLWLAVHVYPDAGDAPED